jgi:hypothetical protein
MMYSLHDKTDQILVYPFEKKAGHELLPDTLTSSRAGHTRIPTDREAPTMFRFIEASRFRYSVRTAKIFILGLAGVEGIP